MELVKSIADSTVRGLGGIGGITLVDNLPVSTTNTIDLVLKVAILIITSGKPLLDIFKTLFKRKKSNEKTLAK